VVRILNKVEKWWIVNFEMAIDSDFADMKIEAKDVISGPVLGVQLLMDVAFGSETESRRYLDAYRKLKGSEDGESGAEACS
jgi:hypothetical protein